MATSDSHLRMTADDERAARVLTLAVKFFGTRLPIASSIINNELYPGLDAAAFSRQFLRDRELLATFGIIIREASGSEADTLWEVDERASYMQDEGLSTKDACMLYVLCHDMAFDLSFPYRDELRIALAKISRMYRGSTIPQSDAMTSAQHKRLSDLISCMSGHHGVTVTYTDAKGVTSTRTLAILGSFGLRDNTYFVASRVQGDGTLVPDSVRTYRFDRFEKVRPLSKCTYQVPADFLVSDYERLPFQMGDAQGIAQFAVPDAPGKQVTRAMDTHGTVRTSDDGTVWEVAFSDVQAAAAWAIGEGVTPLAPNELCAAWHDVLTRAAQVNAYGPSLETYADANQQAPQRKQAGRKGSVTVARQLVALATSLTREGEVITAQNIATTLGVSYDEARHLIALVSMGSGESIDYLPVILSDDDDEVSLMDGAAMSARRVRLTLPESIALMAALDELGVNLDDPLARTLVASYASPSFSPEDMERSFETPSSASDSAVLMSCSQAISAGKGLCFTYAPVTGDASSRRRVLPQRVRRSDDSWYLDAYDLNRQGHRVFRIDRMSQLEEIDPPAHMPKPESKRVERAVIVRFDDQRSFDLFYWEGMQLLAQNGTQTVARIPYYGGTWLARHLAACGGTAQVDNKQLAAQIQTIAQEILTR